MNETTNIIKANEDLKKAFVGILKDLRQITKGFQKLNNIQKKDASESIKKNVAVKQEKYKEKIVQKQKIDKEKKLIKYLKDKQSGDGGGDLLSNILSFAKIFLLTLGAAGLISIIGKTEIGKLLGNLIKSIAESFVSVGKDLLGILGTAFKESSGHLFNAVKAIFAAIGDFFKFIVGALTGTNGYKNLDLAGIMGFFFQEVVVKSFHLLIEVFQLVAKVFVKIFQDNTESIKTGFISLMTSVFDTIVTIVQTVIKTLYSDAGKGQLAGVFDAIKKIFLNVWELLKAAWKGEFKNAKGETTTFGKVVLKYFAIWGGFQLGMIALQSTLILLSAKMAGFFNELDSADSIKCCCDNMANNILDVAEEIEKPTKGGTGGPADQKEKRRRPGSYQEKMEERGRASRGEKPQRVPSKAPSKIELPERMPSGKGGKIRKPGIGGVIGGGCSMACDKAEELLEASKRGMEKVTKVLSSAKNTVMQGGKKVFEWITEGPKKLWGKVTEFGEKIAQKAANLGKGVIDYVKGKFTKYSRYLIAMIKDSKIMKKVIELSVKRLGPAIERLLAKLAAAVLGISTGGVMTVIFGILAAYDMAMLAYGLYQLFFVEPPEGEGLYKEIEQMVTDWWKTLTEPSKEAPAAIPVSAPLAAPKASSAPSAPSTQAPKATSAAPAAASFSGMAGTTKTAASAPASAPSAAPASAPAPAPTTPAVTPAPVAPTQPLTPASASVSIPSTPTAKSSESLDELKKQVIGGKLNNGGPRQKTVAAIIHHTAGRGLEATINTLQSRGLSYHYLIDRDGRIVQTLPDNLIAWHGHPNDKKPSLTNSNTLGIATVAKDDSDITPEQISSAITLEDALAKKYGFPKTDVFGHGEVSSHKHPQEGATIVKAIRGGAMPSKELNIENAKIPTMTGGGSQSQSSQMLNQNIEKTNDDMNELRDVMLDMLSQNLMGDSGGMTIINNNNVNVVNQKGSKNKKFTDPDIAEKIFKNAFAL